MRTPEQVELENMALAAELSRQLCHDLSNFLFNLFLQIEIGQTSSSLGPGDWAGIKREGNKMVRLLQEWERFHQRFSYEETVFDLDQIIREAVSSFDDRPIELASTISAEPLFATGSPIDSARLLRLLIESILQTWAEKHEKTPTLSIHTKKLDGKVAIAVETSAHHCEPENGGTESKEPEQLSLMAAACRSLAVRLDATIVRKRLADGRSVVQIEFPVAPTS